MRTGCGWRLEAASTNETVNNFANWDDRDTWIGGDRPGMEEDGDGVCVGKGGEERRARWRWRGKEVDGDEEVGELAWWGGCSGGGDGGASCL